MSLRVGVVLAALVAGPPLWSLVQAGQLDSDTALTRGLLVGLVCAFGVGLIGRIARGYQAAAAAKPVPAPPADPAPAGGEPARGPAGDA